jgi:3-oxoacyl-[acyl-carrier-protein] synthase III
VPATIAAVRYHLPDHVLTNAELAEQFPEWSVDKIGAKTGIHGRHIVASDEYTSDLAIAASRKLLEETGTAAESIDYLILCTQTPDYYMPSTSLMVHQALGLRADAGATDITLGCSGYVYGLGLAKGLIESGQADRVLLVTGDTYSRLLNPADKSVRTLFGDGATASLVVRTEARGLGDFVYGSDGSGGEFLVVPNGGLRGGDRYPAADPAARGFETNGYDLYMNGPEVFNFSLRVAGEAVDRLLAKAGLEKDDVDTWVFHQANQFMLGHLRRKIGIPEDRFVIEIADVGNTVSSTIPIALARQLESGRIAPGSRSLLLGFGVGLSWGGALIEW